MHLGPRLVLLLGAPAWCPRLEQQLSEHRDWNNHAIFDGRAFVASGAVQSMGSTGKDEHSRRLAMERSGFNQRGGIECRESANEGPPALTRESIAVCPSGPQRTT